MPKKPRGASGRRKVTKVKSLKPKRLTGAQTKTVKGGALRSQKPPGLIDFC